MADECYNIWDSCGFDSPGYCLVPPSGCTTVCDPVCSCGQTTYDNRCLAEAALEDVLQSTACGEVRNLMFFAPDEMTWRAPLFSAESFNIYRAVHDGTTLGPWQCFDPDLLDPSTTIPSTPSPGELWLLGVTATQSGEERTLGTQTTGCAPRAFPACSPTE